MLYQFFFKKRVLAFLLVLLFCLGAFPGIGCGDYDQVDRGTSNIAISGHLHLSSKPIGPKPDPFPKVLDEYDVLVAAGDENKKRPVLVVGQPGSAAASGSVVIENTGPMIGKTLLAPGKEEVIARVETRSTEHGSFVAVITAKADDMLTITRGSPLEKDAAELIRTQASVELERLAPHSFFSTTFFSQKLELPAIERSTEHPEMVIIRGQSESPSFLSVLAVNTASGHVSSTVVKASRTFSLELTAAPGETILVFKADYPLNDPHTLIAP